MPNAVNGQGVDTSGRMRATTGGWSMVHPGEVMMTRSGVMREICHYVRLIDVSAGEQSVVTVECLP
jgi:hypothetical protein